MKIEAELDALNNPASKEIRKAFGNSKIIHFVSSALVHDDERDFLVIEMSVDGPTEKALSLFDDVESGASGLFDPLFQTLELAGTKASFLKRHLVKPGTSYFNIPGLNFSGVPGLTVQRIEQDYRLARGIRDYFDREQPSGAALNILYKLKEDITSDYHFTEGDETSPALATLIPEKPQETATAKLRKATDPRVILQIATITILKLMWPILILAAIATYFTLPKFGMTLQIMWSVIWQFALWSLGLLTLSTLFFLVLLLKRERREEPDLTLPNPTTLSEARSKEDIGQVQNHLFGVSKIKPGILRKISLRLTFLIIGQLAKRSFRPGYLSEIGTINFARWFQIPGTDKLIFCSNYGGSWESYLEDFISKATEGLTGVWSNTLGFPKTRLLFFKGASSGEIFKRWARRQQIPTRFWYSAYPHLTTERIRQNAAIREGLLTAKTATQAEEFLDLFGSAVRPAADVERDEIQSLLFKGLGQHKQSACVLLQLPPKPSDAKVWLRSRLGLIGFDGSTPEARIDQICFTASGLRKLNLNNETLSQFSYPFLQGMDHPERARILADTGEDKADLWRWGHKTKQKDGTVDCAYLIYIRNDKNSIKNAKEEIRRLCDDLEESLGKFGGAVVDCVITSHLLDRKDEDYGQHDLPRGNSDLPREPFGFVDGVSQPIVKGLQRGGRSAETPMHHVEAGEFILGYTDNRGTKTLAPTLQAKYDPESILPDYKDGMNETSIRDFSKNGSYLVIRHLDQNVQSFDEFLERAANEHKNHKGIPKGYTHAHIKEFLAAKMMGRWRDGTSLVKHPHQPGTGWDGETSDRRPDNEFLLGQEDPKGLSCPFGSHVRRTNPRDSFEPHDENELAIVNRHRILRRGRFYSDPNTDQQGLMFMCLNADIERQFEFIQQTWCHARQFMGLDNEVDPILGRGGKMGRVTIPTEQGPIFLKGSPDAVTVVGGGYFFMPSKSALRYLAS